MGEGLVYIKKPKAGRLLVGIEKEITKVWRKYYIDIEGKRKEKDRRWGGKEGVKRSSMTPK